MTASGVWIEDDQAEIVRENRMVGISKRRIVWKQDKRVELLHERKRLGGNISAVNEKLKDQRFVAIAKRSLTQEVFRDIVVLAWEW